MYNSNIKLSWNPGFCFFPLLLSSSGLLLVSPFSYPEMTLLNAHNSSLSWQGRISRVSKTVYVYPKSDSFFILTRKTLPFLASGFLSMSRQKSVFSFVQLLLLSQLFKFSHTVYMRWQLIHWTHSLINSESGHLLRLSENMDQADAISHWNSNLVSLILLSHSLKIAVYEKTTSVILLKM